jgi:sulfur-oxidizing protein SoxB
VQIALSPGFRWGTTLLPGELTGEQIRALLEDMADNLFNPDPYLQQGGDMVRVGGMSYAPNPYARVGARVSDLRIDGEPLRPASATEWPVGI